jgi:hypothetical protein
MVGSIWVSKRIQGWIFFILGWGREGCPQSLQVFCLGVLLAVLGEILLTSVRDDIAMQLAISLAGIVLMVAIGGRLTWYKEGNAMRSDAVIAADTNAAR